MKVFNNGHYIIMMNYEEFEDVMLDLSKDKWKKYLIEAGFDHKDINKMLLHDNEYLLNKLLIECEQQV